MQRAELASAEVGRPQRVIYDLEMAGQIGHEVLEIGCGAGEHSLFFAARGHAACGVDSSQVAIARAVKRARERNLPVAFVVGELLELGRLGRAFEHAVDVGNLHRLDLANYGDYAASVRAALIPGGRLHLLCFGDHERAPGGPPRVTQAQLRAAFADGWRIDDLGDARLESHSWPGGAHAWLLAASRV